MRFWVHFATERKVGKSLKILPNIWIFQIMTKFLGKKWKIFINNVKSFEKCHFFYFNKSKRMSWVWEQELVFLKSQQSFFQTNAKSLEKIKFHKLSSFLENMKKIQLWEKIWHFWDNSKVFLKKMLYLQKKCMNVLTEFIFFILMKIWKFSKFEKNQLILWENGEKCPKIQKQCKKIWKTIIFFQFSIKMGKQSIEILEMKTKLLQNLWKNIWKLLFFSNFYRRYDNFSSFKNQCFWNNAKFAEKIELLWKNGKKFLKNFEKNIVKIVKNFLGRYFLLWTLVNLWASQISTW